MSERLIRPNAEVRVRAAGDGNEYEGVFTTDAPYEFMQGAFEILPMNAKAGDLTRATGDRVMPLLRQHDRDEVIGAVVSDSLRYEDGKLIGRVRFADGASGDAGFGAEDKANVDAGFSGMLSIGYRIKEYEHEEIDGDDYYTAKRWELLEVSVVSIPADRDSMLLTATEAAKAMPENAMTRDLERRKKIFRYTIPNGDEDGTITSPVVEPTDRGATPMSDPKPQEHNDDAAKELARANAVRDLMLKASAFGASQDELKSIGDASDPRERFDELQAGRIAKMQEAQDKLRSELDEAKAKAAADEAVAAEAGDDAEGDEAEVIRKTADRYDPIRAMSLVLQGKPLDGVEGEVEQEIKQLQEASPTREVNRDTLLRLPIETFAKHMVAHRVASGQGDREDEAYLQRATNNDGTSGVAGNVNVGDVLGLTTIDRLSSAFRAVIRGPNVLSQLPIRVMSRVNDGVIGVGSTGMSVSIGDGSSSDTITASGYTTAQRTTQFRVLSAKTDVSRKANRQTEPGAVQLLFEDVMMAIGTQISRLGLFGSGASGQPLGLANGVTGVNDIAVATRGQITYDNYLDAHEETIIAAKGYAGGAGYRNVLSVRAHHYGLKTVQTAGDSAKIITGAADSMGGNSVSGLPVMYWSDYPENDANAANGTPEKSNPARGNGIAGNWMEFFQFVYSPVIEVRRDEDNDNGGETLRFFLDIDPVVVRTPEAFARYTT